MDGNFVKKYELTYEEEEIKSFFERLRETNILPVKLNEDVVRVCHQIWYAERFDLINTLHTGEDIKKYIHTLHESSAINLTDLYILMKSNGEMRNQQVCSIFREFLNIYTYRETACYDAYFLPQIIRKMYELGAGEEVENVDSELVQINTEALKDIGFSIEAKIEKQNEEIKRQKVIKR